VRGACRQRRKEVDGRVGIPDLELGHGGGGSTYKDRAGNLREILVER
jgi:hypothetical protein